MAATLAAITMVLTLGFVPEPPRACVPKNMVVDERYDCRYNPKVCNGGSLCVVTHVECDRITGKVCRQYKREFCVD